MSNRLERHTAKSLWNWGAMLAAYLCLHATAAAALATPIPAGVNGSGPGGFAGWTVTTNPNENNGNLVTVGAFSPVTNVLKLDVTFNNLNPITITFTENPLLVEMPSPIPGLPPILVPSPPMMSTPGPNFTGGLNILIEEKIKNNTGFDWTGFVWVLMDTTPVDPNAVTAGGANAAHPVFPHFHEVNPMFPSFGMFSPFEAKTIIELKNGPFPAGHEDMWMGVRLHNREVAGQLRSFKLIQQPIAVPEPSALVLCGVGILVLTGCHWRHRKQATRLEKPAPEC